MPAKNMSKQMSPTNRSLLVVGGIIATVSGKKQSIEHMAD